MMDISQILRDFNCSSIMGTLTSQHQNITDFYLKKPKENKTTILNSSLQWLLAWIINPRYVTGSTYHLQWWWLLASPTDQNPMVLGSLHIQLQKTGTPPPFPPNPYSSKKIHSFLYSAVFPCEFKMHQGWNSTEVWKYQLLFFQWWVFFFSLFVFHNLWKS